MENLLMKLAETSPIACALIIVAFIVAGAWAFTTFIKAITGKYDK